MNVLVGGGGRGPCGMSYSVFALFPPAPTIISTQSDRTAVSSKNFDKTAKPPALLRDFFYYVDPGLVL